MSIDKFGIKIGTELIWEPEDKHNRSEIAVTDMLVGSDGCVRVRTTDKEGDSFWNTLDRMYEACIPVFKVEQQKLCPDCNTDRECKHVDNVVEGSFPVNQVVEQAEHEVLSPAQEKMQARAKPEFNTSIAEVHGYLSRAIVELEYMSGTARNVFNSDERADVLAMQAVRLAEIIYSIQAMRQRMPEGDSPDWGKEEPL